MLGMIPLGPLVAAIGYLADGWLRTAAEISRSVSAEFRSGSDVAPGRNRTCR
jgi:hypothetical protein